MFARLLTHADTTSCGAAHPALVDTARTATILVRTPWCRNPRRMPMRTLGVSQSRIIPALAVVLAFGTFALLPFSEAGASGTYKCTPDKYGTDSNECPATAYCPHAK